MRYLLFLVTIATFSCKPKPRELLRVVNDQNDGFDAFNIVIYDDSSYVKTEFLSEQTGSYAIINDNIYFKSGTLKNYELVLEKDSSGHISKTALTYQKQVTQMRTLFDSLFFHNQHYQ